MVVVLEATDLVFALDSIPAIFAVTTDPFIVYTSNVFAILGLRALYFLLAGALDQFRYLKVGLGLVLLRGREDGLSDVVRPDPASLAVVALLLADRWRRHRRLALLARPPSRALARSRPMRASGIELQAGGVGKTTHEAPAAEAVAHQDGQLVLAGLQRQHARLVVADQSRRGASKR